MATFIVFCLLLASVVLEVQSEISCTFSTWRKEIECGNQKCSAVTENTPIGSYKLGAVERNRAKGRNWVNLYPRMKSGKGYWDYYCENPDTRKSKIALHPGSRSLGCISIPDQSCWNKLEKLFKEKTPSALGVTGVPRSGWGSGMTFSCNGSLAAGSPITKTVYVIGSLEVN